MARVITDLEMKNTELETKECYCLLEGITPIEQGFPSLTAVPNIRTVGRQTVKMSDRSQEKLDFNNYSYKRLNWIHLK